MPIQWFVKHVGDSLEELIKNYQELIRRIHTYQTTKSDSDLDSIMGRISICRFSINQLIKLAERDIPLAAAYLSDPWIVGKYHDVIPLLDNGISNDRISNDKEESRFMEDDDFIIWKESINQRIKETEGYLEIIKREEILTTK